MKALITGGTGFIGSNLARQLLKDGHSIAITAAKNELSTHWLQGTRLPQDFSTIDFKSLGKIDVVFHQAAINDTTSKDKELIFKINVDASLKLFQDAVANGCKRIVYASSTAIYGNTTAPYKEQGPFQPLNPYAESKLALDEKVKLFAREHPDIVIVGLRYCNVYGPGEYYKAERSTMIYQFAQQMIHSNPKLFKMGEQKRDYIYVKDVVTANLLAAKARESCIVNCGGGKATSFNDLVKILNSVLGFGRTPEYIDNPYEATYQNHTECDMTLAKEKIGFVPAFDIETGIKDYYESGFLVKK